MSLLCPLCFANTGLQRRIEEIRPGFEHEPCDFHPRRKGVPIDAVGAIIDEVFRNNYGLAGGEPSFSDDPEDSEIYYARRGQDLRSTLDGMAQPTNPEITDLVADWLIENDSYWPPDGDEPFYQDEDALYERVNPGEAGHGAAWQKFRDTIMHEQRFFNREADGLLAELFKFIHLQRDEGRKPPVYVLGPQDEAVIHRARQADAAELKKIFADPHQRMGAPPRRAGKPNRMNPSGIAAFYGSFDLKTCLSELRPLVGDQVVTARFGLRRAICVLDTTRFQAPPKELNLFARDHTRRLAQWRFMQRFMAEIAKPISRDDEHLDYVPTQAVSEYLNKVHEVRIGKERRRIDAIIFRSAQRRAGINIVLFGEAALVEGAGKASGARPSRTLPSFPPSPFDQIDKRDPGLVLDVRSVQVSTITEALFDTGDPTDLDFAVNPPF